jgi:hypothetical protein
MINITNIIKEKQTKKDIFNELTVEINGKKALLFRISVCGYGWSVKSYKGFNQREVEELIISEFSITGNDPFRWVSKLCSYFN